MTLLIWVLLQEELKMFLEILRISPELTKVISVGLMMISHNLTKHKEFVTFTDNPWLILSVV